MNSRPFAVGGALALAVSTVSINATNVAHADGYLNVRLTNISADQLRVTWDPVASVDYYQVVTAASRHMDADRHSYRVGAGGPTTLVVDHVSDARPQSGDYTFVEIIVHRRDGSKSDTRSSWIAPPPVAPTAQRTEADSVKIATFNVRTWGADKRQSAATSWTHRRSRVVRTMVRSGAGVFLIQEASGTPRHRVAGRRFQFQDLARRLPDRYALASRALYTYRGKRAGTQGNRIIYDTHLYRKLAQGYFRMPATPISKTRWVPWVELRSKAAPSVEFYAMSTHFKSGDDKRGSTARFDARQVQAAEMMRRVRQLGATGRTVYIGGDFNSTSNTLPYNGVHRTFIDGGLQDAFATRTRTNGQYATTNGFRFPVSPQPYRRDYLMSYQAPPGSYSYKNYVYKSRSSVASDHFMQSAILPVRSGPYY
jgi:endonuclease/exonuclease/phosphatase family metal-dependent hydrolase